MGEVLNLINICPTNPIPILHQHDIFEDFVYILVMIILTKTNNLNVGTGAPP